jgi:hypothetical protein
MNKQEDPIDEIEPSTPLIDHTAYQQSSLYRINCIFCKEAIYNNVNYLPCKCRLPIHFECVKNWKHLEMLCPICDLTWENKTYWNLICFMLLLIVIVGVLVIFYYLFPNDKNY